MTNRGLFEPDVLAKDQFPAGVRRGAAASSEKRLMLAVLENALDYYRKYIFARDAEGQQLFEEAEEWLDSTETEGLFSFRNVCDTLDINPEYLRRKLEMWKMDTLRAQRGMAAAAGE